MVVATLNCPRNWTSGARTARRWQPPSRSTSGRGRGSTDATDPLDFGGFGLRRSRASLHAARQRSRDARRCARRQWPCSASGTISVSRPWRASVRSKRGRQPPRATCLAIDERIGLQRTPLRRSWVRVRIGALRSPVRRRGSPGPKGCPRTCPWSSSGVDPTSSRRALRTEAAAHRIDQRKAGFYPSVNLLGIRGCPVARHRKSHQVGFQLGSVRSGDLAAHFQYRAAAGPNARCPRRVRRRCRDLQRDAVERAARSGGRRDQPQVPGWGARRHRGQRWLPRRKHIRW